MLSTVRIMFKTVILACFLVCISCDKEKDIIIEYWDNGTPKKVNYFIGDVAKEKIIKSIWYYDKRQIELIEHYGDKSAENAREILERWVYMSNGELHLHENFAENKIEYPNSDSVMTMVDNFGYSQKLFFSHWKNFLMIVEVGWLLRNIITICMKSCIRKKLKEKFITIPI